MTSWDDLESDARASSNLPGPKCRMGMLISSLDEKDRESLVRTLANVRLTSTGILKALEKRVDPGDLPSSYAVGRHRRGLCSCRRREDR